MRITLLSCAVLALTTTTAAAQTTQDGPWQPRPTIGVGLGQFGLLVGRDARIRGFRSPVHVDSFKPILSGTVEIPFSVSARIRIEGSRSTLAIVQPATSNQTDTAHIRRLMISVIGLPRPDAPVSPYVGLGVALQRTRFDVAPKSQGDAAIHLHFGVDVPLSDRITVGAEIGLSGFEDDPWFPGGAFTGESAIRLKIGL